MSKHFNIWRKVSPPGIRLQMTLWYTLVSASLLLVFSIIFYTTLQQLLASSFDTTLQLRTQQVAEGITVSNGKVTVEGIIDELPELDATAAIVDPFDSDNSSSTPGVRKTEQASDEQGGRRVDGGKSVMVRVYDKQGNIVYSTATFSSIVLPPDSVTSPLHGTPWRGTFMKSEGQSIRVYSTMLVDKQNAIVGVVQVGQPLSRLYMALQNIVIGLLLTMPFALLCSAFGSYWLAGRAFRPIHRLARTAREIGAQDLHQRVPVPRPKDEVQELSIIFNEMIERLEQAFMQQRRFVADASHELRTPVAVIRSVTEVALSHPSSIEDYQMVLQDVNAETERLGRLISDLLALARADEGESALDNEPVRLDLLAIDVVASLEPLAVERGIKLQTQKLMPATVMGDAARLIQAIMSLVDNALIYTNAGGLVTLSVETKDSQAYLAVCDTGIGIAQEDIEHIFERFYRADPARSKAIAGSGLGLSIAGWVIQVHKGSISVESQPGQGSTFTISLPLMR